MNAKKCDRCGKYYETENSATIQYVYGHKGLPTSQSGWGRGIFKFEDPCF